MKQEHIKISKFLSLILRHQPDTIKLELDPEGWASIDELIELARKHGRKILTRPLIRDIVESNDKQRFSLSEDGDYIRANQGHSIDVNLNLEPIAPPERLYHGTAERFLRSILEQGLVKRSRQHVHLSKDVETATKVGSRHGRPVVLVLDAKRMTADGYLFYCSANGVWLTDIVPPQYLSQDD